MHDGTRTSEHKAEPRAYAHAQLTSPRSLPLEPERAAAPTARGVRVQARLRDRHLVLGGADARRPRPPHRIHRGVGLVLLGLSVGSMTGVLTSAASVRRHGVRLTVALGGTSFTVGIALVAVRCDCPQHAYVPVTRRERLAIAMVEQKGRAVRAGRPEGVPTTDCFPLGPRPQVRRDIR